jgi:DNA-damage-inducible protein J
MSYARTSGIHIRINPEIKANAEPVLAAIGLSLSDAFNLMLHQISLKKRLPFELTSTELTENGYTPEFEAMILKESEEMYKAVANGTAKVYKSTAEMFADWDKEDEEDE